MKLRDILLGLIVITLIFTAYMTAAGDLYNTYSEVSNMTYDEEALGNFTFKDDMGDQAKAITDQVQNGTITETEGFDTISTTAYTAVKMVGQSQTQIAGIFSAVARYIGIPSFVVTIITIMFAIIIIFAIIGYAFRWGG